MPGLIFEEQAPILPSAPNRMDIALMVGFVRKRAQATLPAFASQWIAERGWTAPRYGSRLSDLYDIPIPIEDWQQFDRLFAWEDRTGSGKDGSACLGAALRSFFAQGGRRCYVVRAGNPPALEDPRAGRLQMIRRLLPGYPIHFDPTPADRDSWSGLGHLFGLPDVSLVCLPDLPDLVAVDRTRVPIPDPPPETPEVFVECGTAVPEQPRYKTVRDVAAPRCDEEGYSAWVAAVNLVTGMLAQRVREAEFVAAVPMPEKDIAFDRLQPTAFLQLAYPWITTPGSETLPENLEPPDGALAGILARNALTRGTYGSAAILRIGDISGVFPQLSRMEEDGIEENICLFGPTPSGLRLLSDVTMSRSPSYRLGAVSRLVATIVRTARRIGEEVVFEDNGEGTWSSVRARLDSFMLGLFRDGALRGASSSEAYQVRCDRTTMTQNDIDNGRLVAIVRFDPAAPIETITVVLALNEDRLALAPMSGVA